MKVVRGRSRTTHRDADDGRRAPLVVEVTDSTLSKDRGLVLTYANEEIPVYWLLNIPARRLEVYAVPSTGLHARRLLRAGQDAPVVLDGREVGRLRVADLLP